MELARLADGLVVDARAYRLEVNGEQPIATLTDRAGSRPMRLMLLTALDSDRGPDGTVAVALPAVESEGADSIVIRIETQSTTWPDKTLRILCDERQVAFETSVTGSGRLTDVRLLGGSYSGHPRWGGGLFHSSWAARTLFDPSPDDPKRTVAPAAEPASIGVVGSSQPGRGHWFFTPAPFLLAGSEAMITSPDDPAGAPWTVLALDGATDSLAFTELRYAPTQGGFSLGLAYHGQTAVDGRFTTPRLAIRPGVSDPYDAIADHADRLRASGLAPRVARTPAGWWSRPIFCGWGEQCRQAGLEGEHPASWSRQDRYNAWLGTLAAHRIVPGTITIDDKWQRSYGRNEVDTDRWPDLRGWIASRHDAGQRVLLWFKAWDAEGLPPEACITDPLGRPVAADPDAPAYRAIVRETMAHLLSPGGIDADGLKVDFTAQTPSGPGLAHAGTAWGVALLHRLLELVYRSAKDAKPDALIVTHTPSPHFSDVTDMIRLNDLLRLDDLDPFAPAVPQMRHRARIARAADPGWLIDTDDWCMPSRAEWRAYLAAKPDLGVPALYYATGIDQGGEAFEGDDYAAIREAWARWEARRVAEEPR